MRPRPIVYAHRGASFELPENTLEAFGAALELGADALETDAHLTRDGRVVLVHDPTGARTAGIAAAISSLTLEQLREWDLGARFAPRRPGLFDPGRRYRVPTLDEALAAFPGVVFNVDAKQTAPDMIPALLRVIRGARAADRVRVASFSEKNLRRVRALGYEGETGLAPAEVARALFAPRLAASRASVRGHAAQVPRRAFGISLANRRAIRRLHAAGLRVDFWTIDDPAEAARLFAMGADGVMTDDPRAITRGLRDRPSP